jgi:NADP-dependent 3-hydroxy acid dehydrogenase YdfG
VRTAVVTGASSGFGAEIVRVLRNEGWDVLAGARRESRLETLAEETGCRSAPLDVTDAASVEAFAAHADRVDLLVNNAGGAFGFETIAEADEQHWRDMYETNVLGTVRTTKALLPALRNSGDGLIVNIGSIAGIETYPRGGGYTAAKHALRAVTETLRLELLGEPIRVTEIGPGAAETEFSLVRFDGDAEKAAAVYRGMQPLTASDIAECVRWIANMPSHVNIDHLVVKPRAQARATLVHRDET